jgi:hypothetical protein
MNSFRIWLPTQAGQLLAGLLLAITLLIGTAFSSGNGIQAAAYPVAVNQVPSKSVPQWYPDQKPIDSF